MTGQCDRQVVILGGSGFIGRHLTEKLCAQGYAVRVLTRSVQPAAESLAVAGVEFVHTDPFQDEQLASGIAGADALINLAGILHEARTESFDKVHVELPRRLVRLCQEAGVSRYLHMSALHANADHGPSRYLFSKGRGEDVVHQTGDELAVTSFRPSIVFGEGDNFFSQFAALLRWMPVFPLVCPESRFAPVWVADIAAAFATVLSDTSAYRGQRLNLCGPKAYSFRQLIDYTASALGKKRLILGLPDYLSRMQGMCLERLPGRLFTTDNYLSLQVDSVCDCNHLQTLGIKPRELESVMTPLLCR